MCISKSHMEGFLHNMVEVQGQVKANQPPNMLCVAKSKGKQCSVSCKAGLGSISLGALAYALRLTPQPFLLWPYSNSVCHAASAEIVKTRINTCQDSAHLCSSRAHGRVGTFLAGLGTLWGSCCRGRTESLGQGGAPSTTSPP